MEIIDFRKTNFIMIPRSLVEDTALKQRDKVVYITLCLFTNNTTKSSYPSVEKLATISALSRATILRSLKMLEQSGYIRREQRFSEANSQLTNRYYLLDK